MAIWFCVGSAGAQDIQRFHPALGADGFLGLEGTRTPGMLRGSANLFTDLAFKPLTFEGANGSSRVIEQRLMLHLGLELGLWGRGAIALRLPLIAYDNNTIDGRTDRDVFALTDPQLWLRYRLLGASMDDRDEPKDGPALTLQLGAAFPLGKGPPVTRFADPTVLSRFASDDAVRTEVALVSDFQLLGAAIGGSLGYRHHFWDRDGRLAAVTGASDEMTFAAALKLPIPPLPALKAVLELRGVTGFQSERDTALELGLGGRLTIGDFVIALGGAVGLTNAAGTPDGRIILGVYGVLPRRDQDGDGIDDGDDACEFLAEDMDGYMDDDGCPDPDNDGDLVPDLDDKCPSEPAEEGRDDDEDGCTDPAAAGGG